MVTSAITPVPPVPRVDVSVRQATPADVPFMDSLQKMNGKALGHFPTKQFEGYVEMNAVLVAECDARRVGYIIHRDRYLKRDELGVIFQLCVAQGEQRKLVGATLVKEAFLRSAYGCRLYCLWCAQDLEANSFWESLGFVPIAFRAGSQKKRRVHIFWQKRIVPEVPAGGTKWWYPCQTSGGAIGDDRLVFPIPPGKHWRDEMPVIVPRATSSQPALSDGRSSKARVPKHAPPPDGPVTHGPRQFGPPTASPVQAAPEPAVVEKPKREKKPKVKCDPKHVALARELRDRWAEHVHSGALELTSQGKYDVMRVLPASPSAVALLPAA